MVNEPKEEAKKERLNETLFEMENCPHEIHLYVLVRAILHVNL